jgi:hypothetical protein
VNVKAHELEELDLSIAAHVDWMRAKGGEIPVDARELTLAEALVFMDQPGLQLKPRDARRALGVLSSLRRLCALRDRRAGVERAHAALDARLAKFPQLVDSAPAIRVVLDKSRFRDVERRLTVLEVRANGVRNALGVLEDEADVHAAKLKRHGYAGVAIPQTAHELACIRYFRGRLELLDDEIAAFRGELGLGPVDSRAWHVVRGECIRTLRKADAPISLIQKLFVDTTLASSTEHKKDRTRKRFNQAKKRAKTRR